VSTPFVRQREENVFERNLCAREVKHAEALIDKQRVDLRGGVLRCDGDRKHSIIALIYLPSACH
jgi:hypothetical protein